MNLFWKKELVKHEVPFSAEKGFFGTIKKRKGKEMTKHNNIVQEDPESDAR